MNPGDLLTPEWRPVEARALAEIRALLDCAGGSSPPAVRAVVVELARSRSLLARAHAALVPPPDVARDEVLRLEIGVFLRSVR